MIAIRAATTNSHGCYLQRPRAELLHDLHCALESLGSVAAEWSVNGAHETDLPGIGRTCEGVRRLLIDLLGSMPDA
jgi:hypothetical protein